MTDVTLPEVVVTAPRPLPVPPIPPNIIPAQPNSVPQTGQPLWIRRWKLSVGNVSGAQAIDLSQFSFEFEVSMQQNQTPWKGRVKVWNPPPTLAGQIGKEYTNISLDAGYMQPSQQYDNVIQAQLTYWRWGRQNATDTFLELFIAMYDTAFTAAVVNTWVPAGATKDTTLDAVLAALAPYGVTKGQITQLSQDKAPRGRALVGMVRDIMRDFARTENAKWFIDKDGKLHLLSQDEALALGNTKVPLLSARTGLVDVPTQVLGSGIEIHSLLNPALRPGMQVQVDAASINQLQTTDNSPFLKTSMTAQDPITAKINQSGLYIIGQIKHFGQNRGNPWYSHMVTSVFGNQAPSIPLSAT